jgi:hypothetical protein
MVIEEVMDEDEDDRLLYECAMRLDPSPTTNNTNKTTTTP